MTLLDLQIPYGGKSIEFELKLPEKNVTVIKGKDPPATQGLEELIGKSLLNPIGMKGLSKLVHRGDKIAVMVDDWTRPTPASKIAPIVLRELEDAGVKDKDIIFVGASGMHMPMTEEELAEKVGAEIMGRYEVIGHNAYDDKALMFIGVTSRLGTPLWVNKAVAKADVKISIGRITPHPIAGYEGGGKMIMPGVSGLLSIMHNHSFAYPSYGILDGNPLREDADEVGRMLGTFFILNIVHNSKIEVLEAFSGDPVAAHRKGVRFGDAEVWGAKIPGKADIAIISPGLGKDDYFESVVGCLSKGYVCIKDQGTIIIAASCRRGWAPEKHVKSGWFVPREVIEYSYEKLLRDVELRAWREPQRQFQALIDWTKQVKKTCVDRNVVLVGCETLTEDEVNNIGMELSDSINEAVNKVVKTYGKKAKVIVIPEPDYTLPLERFH